MTATNQQMTSEQLADLSTLAAQLQAKAEANDDRDTAVMAYAVQRACSDLGESRREFTAANATIHNLELKVDQVVAENAGMNKSLDAICDAYENGHSDLLAEVIRKATSLSTPVTDAYLAEVLAQGVDAAIEKLLQKFEGTGHIGVPVMVLESFAAQLRQGAAK